MKLIHTQLTSQGRVQWGCDLRWADASPDGLRSITQMRVVSIMFHRYQLFRGVVGPQEAHSIAMLKNIPLPPWLQTAVSCPLGAGTVLKWCGYLCVAENSI